MCMFAQLKRINTRRPGYHDRELRRPTDPFSAAATMCAPALPRAVRRLRNLRCLKVVLEISWNEVFVARQSCSADPPWVRLATYSLAAEST